MRESYHEREEERERSGLQGLSRELWCLVHWETAPALFSRAPNDTHTLPSVVGPTPTSQGTHAPRPTAPSLPLINTTLPSKSTHHSLIPPFIFNNRNRQIGRYKIYYILYNSVLVHSFGHSPLLFLLFAYFVSQPFLFRSVVGGVYPF